MAGAEESTFRRNAFRDRELNVGQVFILRVVTMHKFRVGQLVEFRRSAPAINRHGVFVVTKQLPGTGLGSPPEYRLVGEHDHLQRAASEPELQAASIALKVAS